MKTKAILGILVGAGMLGLLMAAAEDEKPAGAKPDVAGQDAQLPGGMTPEMMKKWEEYATPGPHHKHLDALVGKWTYTGKWWMAPDAPAEEMKGDAEYTWILDGHYIKLTSTSPADPAGGPAFEGLGMFGYDNFTKDYFSTWMDSMGTGIMILRGTCDADGKTFKFAGTCPDPMTGEKEKKCREVVTMLEKDKHNFEMYTTGPDGKEFKCMEIHYTRAAGGAPMTGEK